MPRTATVGPEIYERVNTLVGEGKSRTEAFQLIGEERGSRPGTIAANYYRVARAQGKTSSSRRRSAGRSRRHNKTTAPSRGRAGSRRTVPEQNGDIGQLAKQIAELTQQLVRRVEERDEQLRKLLA